MAIRYTDFNPATSGARDFVIRQQKPTLPELAAIFLSAFFIIMATTIIVASKTLLIILLFVTLGTLGWYVLLQTQRNRDLVMATEFQNALFASALGSNNRFCIIIRRDGTMVYFDRSFQEMFPQFPKQSQRSIDTLLEYARVARPDRDKIFSSIERGVYDKVIFDLHTENDQFQTVVMSVEPILRPNGFILLRGRDYVETRKQGQPVAAKPILAFNKSTVTLFSHVMDSMNTGVYITGPEGNIVYTNPVLEQWLEFKEGEIISSNLSLQDMVQQSGGKAAAIEPDNYEGEVTLMKKPGGTMKAYINQKIIRDEHNKVLGCTALVQNFGEQRNDAKKKLW